MPLFLLLGSQAVAQNHHNKVETFAGAGWTRFDGDEGSLGNGPGAVGGIGYRLASRASVELDLMRLQHQRNFSSGVRFEGTATGVFGDLAYHFSEARTQPFVMASAGVLHSSRTSNFPEPGGAASVIRSHDNTLTWGGGAGVKIFLNLKLSLRPQFRGLYSEAAGVLGLLAGSVAIGYHW